MNILGIGEKKISLFVIFFLIFSLSKKQLVSKRTRSNGELKVSAVALSNIEQWDTNIRFKHVDEIKQIEDAIMDNSWEMRRHWRNYRERMDVDCWDYMVLPNELKFIRDVIKCFADRHSGIQHFEHVELDEWRRKVKEYLNLPIKGFLNSDLSVIVQILKTYSREKTIIDICSTNEKTW